MSACASLSQDDVVVQLLSRVQLFATPWMEQHARLPCPSPPPGACSNSCPSSQWCHPTVSSSFVPLSSCLQSFPASGSSLMRVLAKMDSTKEAYGHVDVTPFLISKKPFWSSIVRRSPWPWKWEIWGLLPGQGLASPPLHLGMSVHRGQAPAVQPGTQLSPASIVRVVFVFAPLFTQTMFLADGMSCCLFNTRESFLPIFVGESFVGETSTGYISLLCLNM